MSRPGSGSIVAIGASAGGLDACRKLLEALPAHNGMAFIIVQHLDPSHNSMMADLLAGHTSMPVLLATDGMKIESERVYVIPPGVYLSADDKGALRLSKPQARHGARLPFDFLLNSLARQYGARTVCVVLSGTGADGSLGLKAIIEAAGLPMLEEWHSDFGSFYKAVEWMGLQRHLKILGIFARLTLRDCKPKYLADTPRFIGYVRATCQRYIELKPLMRLIDQIEA